MCRPGLARRVRGWRLRVRFVWAVVAFFLAAVCIGAGIAQRTVFMGPKTEQAAISVSGDPPYTLIDGAVLSKNPGAQTLMIRGEGEVFAAYGRTSDMTAWLSEATFNHVTLKKGKVVTEEVAPTVDTDADAGAEAEPTPGTDAGTTTGTDGTSGAPPGATRRIRSVARPVPGGRGALIAPLKLPPETMSVLVASDGTAPAPSDITVSWPIDNSTPWAGPLLVLGGLLLAAGVALWLLGIRHVRRSRGPRRKGLPQLPTEPIDLAVEEADKGVISAAPTAPRRGRRLPRIRRDSRCCRLGAAVRGLLGGRVAADRGAAPTPSASETVIVPRSAGSRRHGDPGGAHHLGDLRHDRPGRRGEGPPRLAATRLEGMVLAERETNCKLQGAVRRPEGSRCDPAKPIAALLPPTERRSARSVTSIVYDNNDETVAPTIMYGDPAGSVVGLSSSSYIANLRGGLGGASPASPRPDHRRHPGAAGLAVVPDPRAGSTRRRLRRRARAKGDKSQYAGLFDLSRTTASTLSVLDQPSGAPRRCSTRHGPGRPAD